MSECLTLRSKGSGRLLAAFLLFAFCCLVVFPAWAGEAASVEVCGALFVEPELAAAWPGGKTVRPGEVVLSSDKGFGCRFVLHGEPKGAAAMVEVRLTRPSSVEGRAGLDRWFVPVRRGEPDIAVYAFSDSGPPESGTWTLELLVDDIPVVSRRFTVASPVTVPSLSPPINPQPSARLRRQ